MNGRGLRGDIRQQTYDRILDAAPVGDRSALRDASGPSAQTAFERERQERRVPCRVFTTSGCTIETCERCGHTYPAHRAWRTNA